MPPLLRRLRGALGIGLTWAASWTLVGLAAGGLTAILDPDDIDAGEGVITVLRVLALVGFLSGLGFAALFSFLERKRAVDQLSLGRAAAWGALGSAGIPFLMGADAGMGLLTGGLGAIFAAASIATARRELPAARKDASLIR